MRWHAGLALLIAPFVVVQSCQSPRGGPDAGVGDDGLDGLSDPGDPSADRGADWEDGGPGDLGLERDFAILIPAGAQACSMCGGWNGALAEYRHKGRVTFRPGVIRLPRDQATVEADLIEKLELGPERLSVLPQAPGVFSRQIAGSAENGTYHYEYNQTFDTGLFLLGLILRTRFTVQNGTAVDQLLVLDRQTLSVNPWDPRPTDRFQLTGYLEDGTAPTGQWIQMYSTCDYQLFEPKTVEVDIQGGDRLILDYRCPDLTSTIVILTTICPCPLVSSEFSIGAERRQVQDHFRLVLTSVNHCCMDQTSLVVFDEPVGAVGGLQLAIGPHCGLCSCQLGEIHYLDPDLNLLETRPVTGWRLR